MTEKVILSLFSNNAKELADFYSEVLGGKIVRLFEDNSQETYLYEFER